MWAVAQEEMDFEREAANIRRVRENIEGIKYVYCPKVYDELSQSTSSSWNTSAALS